MRKKNYRPYNEKYVTTKMRYQVLRRDRYRCVLCGRSPAKSLDVELHIDHIIPFCKGGETTVKNLQTLCSECNLGKSDSMPEEMTKPRNDKGQRK